MVVAAIAGGDQRNYGVAGRPVPARSARAQSRHEVRGLTRTPGAFPFENSIPSASSARRISASVLGYGVRAPRSKSATVCLATAAFWASTVCDQSSSARAARHCAGSTGRFFFTMPLINIDIRGQHQYYIITLAVLLLSRSTARTRQEAEADITSE